LTDENVKVFDRRFDVDTEGFKNQMAEMKPFRPTRFLEDHTKESSERNVANSI
jgi:hypothetical protein